MPYACPECLHALAELGDDCRCPSCERTYARREGIPVLTDGRHYYGELAQAEMRELLAAIGARGFEAAVVDVVPRLGWAHGEAGAEGRPTYSSRETARLIGHMFDPSRAAWKFLCDVTGRRVLDAGCGTGQIAANLAQTARSVTALDPTWERVAFARERARFLECDARMDFVCGGDTPHLPFPDGTFDLVVVNGVLEWVPLSREGEPTAVEIEYLRDLARVLAPGGELYLAIENRASLLNLLGGPDPHTGLRFGSVLPRPLADLYSRLVRRQPYRNYIFTLSGYRHILTRAGLSLRRAYAPLPTYQNPRLLVPLDGRPASTDWQVPGGSLRLGDRLKLAGARLGLKLPAGQYLVPAYSLLAGKQGDDAVGPGDLARLVEALAAQTELLPSGRPADLRLCSYTTSPHSQSVILDCTLGECGCVVKLPLSPASRERVAANVDFLRGLDPLRPTLGPTAGPIPRVLYAGELNGQYVAVESRCPGITAAGLRAGSRRRAARTVLSWLLELQSATARAATLTADDLAAGVTRPAELLARYRPRCGAVIGGAAARLRDLLLGRDTPLVISHGDPQAGNFLLDPGRHTVTGVVDWDRGTRDGLPMVDTISYLAKEQAPGGANVYERFRRGWLQLAEAGLHHPALLRGWTTLALEPDLLRPLLLVALLSQAAAAFRTQDPLSLRLPLRDEDTIMRLVDTFCDLTDA